MKVCLVGDLTSMTPMWNMIIISMIWEYLSKTVVQIHLSTTLTKNKVRFT